MNNVEREMRVEVQHAKRDVFVQTSTRAHIDFVRHDLKAVVVQNLNLPDEEPSPENHAAATCSSPLGKPL